MKKILIIDDATYMQMMLRKILEKSNYEVIGEASGKKEAIRKFVELKPDMVTLDLSLSGSLRDGVEVLVQLMNIDPGVAVIIISASGQQDLIDECLSLGARHFITKPIETSVLLSTLEMYK